MPERPVCRLDELEPTDAVLVSAFRHWAVGVSQWRTEAWVEVWAAFRQLLGPDRGPADTLRSFDAVMQVIGRHARREIQFHGPHCPCVDADELDFLRLVHALGRGEERAPRRIAAAFVRPQGVDGLLANGRRFARHWRELVSARPGSDAWMAPGLADTVH
ncbi:MAG: hypothetical protein R3225_04055 [Halofilum sp. (in: g-proteobacteria)]|nr:hypothetical protein [Halofilum sp. (in: g-proteobacteria)]